MPTFQFEAMDSTGQEIKDVIEAPTEAEAQATIRQMGYFVTRIRSKKNARKRPITATKKKPRSFAIGGVSRKLLTTFTRQLSILQDAGLPILRSLRILEGQQKPGRFKNSLMDVCDEIEGGATLSEAMAKSPKAFDRLYVNMIKAGEAGGALGSHSPPPGRVPGTGPIAQAKSQRRDDLPGRRRGGGRRHFDLHHDQNHAGVHQNLRRFQNRSPRRHDPAQKISEACVHYWFLIPLIPTSIWLFIKLIRKFDYGRIGWDLFTLKVPVFGQLVEKNIMARTTRTLGTLVSSGVPILEALNITRETSGNAMFERLYGKVIESIRQGESIAKPLKEHSDAARLTRVTVLFWFLFSGGPIGLLLYLLKMKQRVVDDLVVNMVDVGEETGELDTMLYKVADTYDEEVAVLTESLVSLLEPLLIVFLGGMVMFIVVSLFMPLVKLITDLSGGATRGKKKS